MASPRNKHPYLLWVALMSFLGGQGVELYYHGMERFYLLGGSSKTLKSGSEKGMRESGYVDIDGSGSESDLQAVNGEKVEVEMNREKWTQSVRTGVAGLGCLMGVVGIWGDGA
jgi:autophagy-related protein 33